MELKETQRTMLGHDSKGVMWHHKMPQITLASDQGGNPLQKQDV